MGFKLKVPLLAQFGNVVILLFEISFVLVFTGKVPQFRFLKGTVDKWARQTKSASCHRRAAKVSRSLFSGAIDGTLSRWASWS